MYIWTRSVHICMYVHGNQIFNCGNRHFMYVHVYCMYTVCMYVYVNTVNRYRKSPLGRLHCPCILPKGDICSRYGTCMYNYILCMELPMIHDFTMYCILLYRLYTSAETVCRMYVLCTFVSSEFKNVNVHVYRVWCASLNSSE